MTMIKNHKIHSLMPKMSKNKEKNVYKSVLKKEHSCESEFAITSYLAENKKCPVNKYEYISEKR